MNYRAVKKLRDKIASDEVTYGLWVTLESASITEIAVASGLDWVVVDAEHGHLDWHDILEHTRAAVRSNTVLIVRIAEANQALVKRAFDIGADGIIVPWIDTAEQLELIYRFAHYPPTGMRGMGGERATCWNQRRAEHIVEAEENLLIIPMIESVTAAKNIEAMLKVEGIDFYFLGPADLSSTAGYPGEWEGPGVAEQVIAVKDAIRAQGKHCGVVAQNREDGRNREHEGFKMIGIGADTGMIWAGIQQAMAGVGCDKNPKAALSSFH